MFGYEKTNLTSKKFLERTDGTSTKQKKCLVINVYNLLVGTSRPPLYSFNKARPCKTKGN